MGDKGGGGGSSPPPIFYQDPRSHIDEQLGAQLEQMTLLTESLMNMVKSQSTPPELPPMPNVIGGTTGADGEPAPNRELTSIEDKTKTGEITVAKTPKAAEIDPDALPVYRPKPINWTEKIRDFKGSSEKEVEEMVEQIKGLSTLATSPLIGTEEPDLIKTILGGF